MSDIPPKVLQRVSQICLALPEAHEEPAWVGCRWRVRQRTFAHLLTIADGKPDAYARFAASDGPVTIVTFRAPADEIESFAQSGPPYFVARWGRDVVGYEFTAQVDYVELRELLTDSFCVMAPQKLAAQVGPPPV